MNEVMLVFWMKLEEQLNNKKIKSFRGCLKSIKSIRFNTFFV